MFRAQRGASVCVLFSVILAYSSAMLRFLRVTNSNHRQYFKSVIYLHASRQEGVNALPGLESLENEIVACGNKLRALKETTKELNILDPYIAELLNLKDRYRQLTGELYSSPASPLSKKSGKSASAQPLSDYIEQLKTGREAAAVNISSDVSSSASSNSEENISSRNGDFSSLARATRGRKQCIIMT